MVLEQFPDLPLSKGPWRTSPYLCALRNVWHQLRMEEGILYRYRRPSHVEEEADVQMLVVSRCLVPKVLGSLHYEGGHFGIDKTVWPCRRSLLVAWVH